MKLYLRELQRSDIPLINKWRNNPNLISYLGAPFRFINQDVDDAWFASYMASRSNTIRCSICDTEDDTKIYGLVSLTGIDFINRTAILHIMIGDEENCGRGIGTFAVNEMLYHAFNNINLNRVELDVLSTNERAFKLYKKVGFTKEGTKRQAVYKNGEYQDMVQMSLLSKDYKNNISYTIVKGRGGGGGIISGFCISLVQTYGQLESAIHALQDAFSPSLSERIKPFQDYITKLFDAAQTFVAFSGSCLGVICVYLNDYKSKEAYITQVLVAPEHQGKHIGFCLLQFAIEAAKDKRLETIKLEVQKDNAKAIALYKKCGFSVCDDNGKSWYMKRGLRM